MGPITEQDLWEAGEDPAGFIQRHGQGRFDQVVQAWAAISKNDPVGESVTRTGPEISTVLAGLQRAKPSL